MPESKRLTTLWKTRDTLLESEWGELYQLVCSILKRSHPSILRSLPESKEHYIQDFFLLKVFEPAKHASASPHGANELCTYFNNYLIDVYRSAALRTTDLVENYDEVGRHCESLQDEPDVPGREFLEYGFSPDEVHQQARSFLNDLDEVGRVYLALHACADAPEPLYKLAERLRIPSYHSRALQLGITRKKGAFADGYENTQIGSWLTEGLGLELSANAAVLTALKILCLESLQLYQQPRSGDA